MIDKGSGTGPPQDGPAAGDTPSGTMRSSASFQSVHTPVRVAGYLLLGASGSIALAWPLAGVLSYFAGFLTPLLFAWFLYGGILALTRQPRMARVYVFTNLGVLAATLLAMVGTWITLVAGGQPYGAASAPAYLALVLAGAVAGIVLGSRRPPEQPAGR